MKADLNFLGAGCNRCVGVVTWGGPGLVAYGAHRSVFLFNPEVLLCHFKTLKPYENTIIDYWSSTCKRFRLS
jgi:hypothetical protein